MKLEDNPSYCMKALADTDEIFEQMITYSTHTLSSLLNSFHSLVLDSNTRGRLYSICNDNKGEALLCVMLTPYEIIVICKSENIMNVTSHDIVLIQNLIFSSESLKQTECWIPICLPGISDAGYLQIYCNFLDPNIGIAFITESQEHSYFLKFSEQSANIFEIATKENLIESVKSSLQNKTKSSLPLKTQNKYSDPERLIDELFLKIASKDRELKSFDSSSNLNDPFSQVKYLVCKSKNLNQFFTFRFNDFDKLTKEENQILINYSNLYDIYNSQNMQVNQNNFFFYEKDEKLTNVIQANENYILFATFNFFKDFDNINAITLDILKMMKNKESSFFCNKY